MLRELKYLLFILTIALFIFLILQYYFSDNNKKKSFRAFEQNDKKIIVYSKKLMLLENDTNDIIEYVEKTIDKNKKNYNFWELINDNQ
jgi:hypothetical protein